MHELQKVIGSYLDSIVKAPAFETVEKDFSSQDRLADALTILNVVLTAISKKDSFIDNEYFKRLTPTQLREHEEILIEFIDTGEFNDKVKNILVEGRVKKHLFAYVSKELNWVVVSILSASYISANIIMRSLLELLIGIATNEKGSMNTRISGISFLSQDERENIKNLWHEFCAWSHPYQKWEKEVCPIFVLHKPMYYVRLCQQSIDKLERIIDFLLIIAVEKCSLDYQKLTELLTAKHADLTKLAMFNTHFLNT